MIRFHKERLALLSPFKRKNEQVYSPVERTDKSSDEHESCNWQHRKYWGT